MRPSRPPVTENPPDTPPADLAAADELPANGAQPVIEAQAPSEGPAGPTDPEPVADDEQPAAAAQPVVDEGSPDGEAPAEAPVEARADTPADPPAPAESSEAPLSGDTGSEHAAAAAPPPAASDTPPPGAGPKILGMAEDVTPPLPAVKASLKDLEKRERPRRRRLNATQRHRNLFFARLNEFRRQVQADEDPEPEAAEAEDRAAEAAEPPADPIPAPAEGAAVEEQPAAETSEAEAPAPETPQAEAGAASPADAPGSPEAASETDAVAAGGAPADGAQPVEADRAPKRRSAPPPHVDKARLIAAIERAGGADVIVEALQPKRDEHDQPLKWATVCADACKGLKPSDPVFSAWVRLAATPVSAIKNELGLNERRDDRRGRGRGGPRRGGERGRGRDDRGRGDRVSREDFERLSTGGRVGANIRIIGLDADAEKKERDARRKAEREAKRQAERDRLARLGY